MPFVPDSDPTGLAPARVPVGKTQAGVLAALDMPPEDQAHDDALERRLGDANVASAADAINGTGRYANQKPRNPAMQAAVDDISRSQQIATSTPAAAPTGRFVPDEQQEVLHGADAIPKGPALPSVTPAPLPAPEPTLTDKVVGGIEAGLNVISGITNYGVGLGSGAVRAGIVGAAEGAGAIATKLDQASRGVSAPLPEFTSPEQSIQQEIQNVTVQPQTPTGKQYTEAAQDFTAPVMELLPAALGHGQELAAAHESAAPVARAVVDTARVAASKAAELPAAAARGVGNVIGVDPELAKIAQTASSLKYPIDVRPDQVIENAKFSKLVGQASSDVPLAGSKNASNQQAFTKNLIDAINPDESADRLTPEVFADAMNRSGQGIGDILAKTPVPVDDFKGLDALREDANKFATDSDKRIVNNYIDELQSKADENGVVDGTALKELNSEIGLRARSEVGNDLGRRLNDLQGIIQDAANANVADPAEAATLKDYRRQYAYGKIVEPLVAKTIDGNVPPSALMARVTATNLGKHLMATSKGGPIGDLAKVGKLIKEPSSSGTAERNLVYGAATDAAKAAKAAVLYPTANVYNRLGPKLTRAMVGKRAAPPIEPEPGPPPEPTTSPGAGGGGGGAPPAGPASPLGDLTPDWTTAPGAGGGGAGPAGGPPGGPAEPGLVRSLDEAPPTTGNRKAPLEVPAVPGRPDLPDTMVSGGPAETAATEASNAAMNEPGAIEARRQQNGAAARQSSAQGPSIAEAQRLLAENPSPEVRKVLEDHIEAAKQVARDRAAQEEKDAQAAQIERTARTTTDPVIQKKLLDQADKLRGTERIPVGETREGQPPIEAKTPTKPLPVGKVIEGEPAAERVPTGRATEKVLTEQEWRDQFKLGDDDAERAKAVAQALQHDPEAVEKAAVQHEKSPRAFDRVIQEINYANEAKPAAEGGESIPGAAGPAAEPGETVRPGEGGAPVRGEPAGSAVPAAERGTEDVAKLEPGAAVPGADEHAGADRVPAPGPDSVSTAGGGQDAGEQEGAGTAGLGARNDTSTTGSGNADRVRGQGQTPLHGELSDEAFQVEKKSLAQKAVGDNFDRDKAVAALPKAVRNDPLFRPEKAGARDVGASDAVWQKLQDFSRQEGLPDYSLNADDLGNVIVGKPLSPDQFAKVAKYADDNDLGVYVLKNAAGEDVADVKAMRAAGFESAQGLGLYGNGRHVESSIPPGRAAYVYKPRGFSEFLFRSGEASAKPFNNAAELESHLREQLGNKLIDGLQAQGLLRFANSEAEGRRGARGMMKQNINDLSDMSDTHATLYYDRLSPDNAAGTLMHELGEHFGMIRLLGKDRYKVFLNEVRELGKSSDPEIKAAWDDVADRYVLKPTDKGDAQFMGGNRANPLKYADTSNPNFLREVAAKLIETKPDLPFVRRVINDIRVFFYTHFGTTLGSSVDASLIRGLGAAALRKAGEGKLEGQTATAKLPLAAKSYAPMVAKRNDGFPPLYQ